MKKYKYLFCDFDGTLVDTISGKTFPEGVWDMKVKFDVLDKIKELNPEYVFIVSNQGGIESGFINEKHFTDKCQYVCDIIKEYCKIEHVWFTYCATNDKTAQDRKPNTAMLEYMLEMHSDNGYWFNTNNELKNEILMIGDASGKEGQFSDSDKKCAENFGIDYLDVNDFLNYGNI
jgi:DNA 3'-phosphatase